MLCISAVSVVTSPSSFQILLIWVLSLFFLMSLANGFSILFIFSKNQLLVLLILAIVFLLRFYLSFESGTMYLSGNFIGLSHCFNHANKATALKMWAELCQLQTAAAQPSHQSTCRAPSISVPAPRASRINISSGFRPWPLLHWCCCLQASLPSSGPSFIHLMPLTRFWAHRDHCADGVSMNVKVAN